MTCPAVPGPDFPRGILRLLFGIPFALILLAHLAGSSLYAWLQPRGFELWTAFWLEQQVLIPALAGLSAAAVLGILFRRPVAWLATSILIGFWLAVSAAAAFTGTTIYALTFWILLPVLLLFAWALRVAAARTGAPDRICLTGWAAGLVMGTTFLFCAWAPSSTTVPSGDAVVLPPKDRAGTRIVHKGGWISVQEDMIVAQYPGGSLGIRPLPRAALHARSGFWSIFDPHTYEPPPWEVVGLSGTNLLLRASDDLLEAAAIVRVGQDDLVVRVSVTLRKDVTAHLAESVRITGAGPVKINGRAWKPWDGVAKQEFVAFRNGKLEYMRAHWGDWGPFETLESWDPADPEVRIGPFTVRVRGWAAQASRAPSPTTGWGVSQGTVELVDLDVIWTLASTAPGIGWHTVRTGAGTYSFNVTISR